MAPRHMKSGAHQGLKSHPVHGYHMTLNTFDIFINILPVPSHMLCLFPIHITQICLRLLWTWCKYFITVDLKNIIYTSQTIAPSCIPPPVSSSLRPCHPDPAGHNPRLKISTPATCTLGAGADSCACRSPRSSHDRHSPTAPLAGLV